MPKSKQTVEAERMMTFMRVRAWGNEEWQRVIVGPYHSRWRVQHRYRAAHGRWSLLQSYIRATREEVAAIATEIADTLVRGGFGAVLEQSDTDAGF